MPKLIIIKAREWLGTPWKHNTAIKGVGVDCVKFLTSVAEESGINISPIPSNYARVNHNSFIEDYLDDNFLRASRIDEGHILMISSKGLNTHVALATGIKTMIHASYSHKRVLEHEIDDTWFRLIKGVWKT